MATVVENLYMTSQEEAHATVVLEPTKQQCKEVKALIQGLREKNAILKE